MLIWTRVTVWETTFVKFSYVACHKPAPLLMLEIAFSTNSSSVLLIMYLVKLCFGGYLSTKRQLYSGPKLKSQNCFSWFEYSAVWIPWFKGFSASIWALHSYSLDSLAQLEPAVIRAEAAIVIIVSKVNWLTQQTSNAALCLLHIV